MLVSTNEQGLVIAPPRSFAGLMALYENNYIRLQRILPGLRIASDKLVSRVAGDETLYLDVRERCRYTTTLRLTYWFEEEGVCTPDPDLLVKVYHDARMVEAWGCGPHYHHRLLRGFPTDAPDELTRRWALNMMLNKWLEYCRDRGHRLQPAG